MAALTAGLILLTVTTMTLNVDFLAAAAMFFAVIATVVYGVMYVIISIRHLSTQLCSNESYMNYSLPASSHTLVLSKLICILLWGIVSLLLIVFFWIVGVGGIMLAESEMSLSEIWNAIVAGLGRAGIRNISSILSMVSWIGISLSIMSLCLLGFCVTLCNVPALKERGIGVVTGVVGFFVMQYTIYNIISSIVGAIFRNVDFDIFSSDFIYSLRAPAICTSIAYMVAAIGLYFLTVYTVDKHRFIG
jgi:hypothetical protein